MSQFSQGDAVGIPCDVGHGAFADEYLVTILTVTGPISGFVTRDDFYDIEGDKGNLRGIVIDVAEDTVTVKIRGSFFTTTGLAYLPRDWALTNLKPL